MLYRLSISICFFFFLTIPLIGEAQTPFTSDDSPSAVSFSVSPDLPRPGQTVEITAESSSLDLQRAEVTWRVDGSVVQQDIGANTYTLTAGELGSEQRISITAHTEERQISGTHTLRPTRVSIGWEGETYTHPFYKGAALHTPGSEVTLVAFPEFVRPDGTRIDPDNLVYTWRRDNTVLGGQSGFGAQSITLENPGVLRDLNIRVDVSTQDEILRGRTSVTIPVSQPELRFYTVHPLLGTQFNQAHDTDISIDSDELTLTAVPYFMSVNEPATSDLSYAWSVNDESVSVGEQQNVLTLRPQGSGGSAAVSLEINHASRMLQNIQRELTVTF